MLFSMLPSSITQEAFAKINVHLAVSARREDGYHDLSSLFQLISLHDTVSVAVSEAPCFSCVVRGLEGICPSEDNSMSKAARLWCQCAGVSCAVVVDCMKRIPVEAGLGGGSSDAAAVLCALESLFPEKAVGARKLMALGLRLGSDVPFFLCGSTAAWGRGRGEWLTPVATPSEYHVLVVMPRSFSVSTANAFAALDMLRAEGVGGCPATEFSVQDIACIYGKPCATWPFFNDFSQVIGHEDFYSVLDAACKAVGNTFGSLTGSGAAWYAVSLDNEALDAVCLAVATEFGDEVCTFRAKMLCNQLCDGTL